MKADSRRHILMVYLKEPTSSSRPFKERKIQYDGKEFLLPGLGVSFVTMVELLSLLRGFHVSIWTILSTKDPIIY